MRKNAQELSILMKKILHVIASKPAFCNDNDKKTNQENQRSYIFVINGTVLADNEALDSTIQTLKTHFVKSLKNNELQRF